MTIERKVVFLAADTARSNAYAQALANAGVNLSAVALLSPEERRWGQTGHKERNTVRIDGLFLPDFALQLEDVCNRISPHVDIFKVSSINAPAIVAWLEEQSADLVVFSGFGGELVKRDALEVGAPFLHMHGGWVPEYRGSTTIYYSLLGEDTVGVSAILLTESIDEGPVVARKKYEAPPSYVDLDYYYDSAVRADLLVAVLEKYIKIGGFVDVFDQSDSEGTMYYIIHPLLKHIVLNRLGRI